MVNLQTASYTIQQTDYLSLVSFSSASALTATLPSPTANCWTKLFQCAIENRGTGTLTVQPAAGTIDGVASLALAQNQGVLVSSDGSNWYSSRGMNGWTDTIPASSSSSGLRGQYTCDGSFFYIYTGTAWRRVAVSSF